jgi:hypothetical protein
MIQGAITMSVTDTPSVEAEASDELDGFDDESWLASSHPRGVRIRLPLAALTLGLVLALGLWGGATLQASQNPAAAAATAGAFPAGGAGRGGGGGAGNAAGGGLSGTVASVQGSTIELTTSTGATVTVTLLPSTTITRTAAAAPTDITAGETITVRGATGADGTTAAQSVAIVPASTTGG